MAISIRAKYAGKCPSCGNRFKIGIDWITNASGNWAHVQCPSNGHGALGTTVKGHKYGVNEPLPIETNPIIDTDALSSLIDNLPDEPKPVEKVFTPSKYQQDFFDALFAMIEGTLGFLHIVVEAVAGSGKTTTLIEGIRKLIEKYSGLDICIVAFNVHIKKEFQSKLDRMLGSNHGVLAITKHALGLRAIKKSFPQVKIDDRGEKMDAILNDIYPVSRKAIEQGLITKADKKENYPKRASLRKLVSICKSTLVDVLDANAVLDVINRYNVEIDEKNLDELIEKLPLVMQKCKENTDLIDFDDMGWLPIVLNLETDKFDVLMIDEFQDMSKGDTEFLFRCIKDNGHIIGVGDRHQSLYAFRGADSEAIPNAIERLDAKVLPLSVTYRCPVSHVKLAKEIVPQLEARENAPEGEIIELDYDNLVSELKPRDMVICRTNAPLVQPAFECVRQGKKAIIRSDIEKQLLDLIARFDTDNLNEFQINLEEYYRIEHQKKIDAGKEMQAEMLTDRFETINFIIQEGGRIRTVSDLVKKIKDLFSDDVEGIVFSSVHKAKGLEADRVFILRPDLMPHKRAKKEHEIAQEYNCKYVAETRSKNSLVFVQGGINA